MRPREKKRDAILGHVASWGDRKTPRPPLQPKSAAAVNVLVGCVRRPPQLYCRNSIHCPAGAIVASGRNESVPATITASTMAHHHDHHDHSHGHSHAGHSHAPDNFGFAFAAGVMLNTVFVIAELIFGYAANSLALISDAVHNFSDVIALLLAWGAVWLARKQPTEQHTYGYRRGSVLAALIKARLLLIAGGGVFVVRGKWDFEPPPLGGGACAA